MSDSLLPQRWQHASLPVPHHLLKFAQVHVYCIGDAIQSTHPMMPSCPSALNLSQHQGLFQWVSCSHQMIKILVSATASALPVSIQGWFHLRLTGLIFLPSNWLSGVFSSTTVWRCSAFFSVHLSQPYVTTGKTIVLTISTSVSRVMSLLFNTLTRFVIVFLPRSNHLLISWLQSPSTVISEPRMRKSVTASTFSPSICHEVMGLDAVILVFSIFCFKPALWLSSFTLNKTLFSSSWLTAIRMVSSKCSAYRLNRVMADNPVHTGS